MEVPNPLNQDNEKLIIERLTSIDSSLKTIKNIVQFAFWITVLGIIVYVMAETGGL